MNFNPLLTTIAHLFLFCGLAYGQDAPKQDDYYQVIPIPVPEGIVLEAGGLDFMPDGKLAVSHTAR